MRNKTTASFGVPALSDMLESRIRADLMSERILPRKLRSEIALQSIDRVVDILRLLFRLYLPSENTAILQSLSVVETKLKHPSSSSDASETLRSWSHQLRVLTVDLKGKAEPLRLWEAIKDFAVGLAKTNFTFVGFSYTELLKMTNIETVCTSEAVELFCEGLEGLTHAYAVKEEGEARRTGKKNQRDAENNTAEANGSDAKGKGKSGGGKGGKGNGKDTGKGKSLGKSDPKAPALPPPPAGGRKKLCEFFGTDTGCKYGKFCRDYHPSRRSGKCNNCGHVKHVWKDCKRPGGGACTDPNPPKQAPKAPAKAKANASEASTTPNAPPAPAPKTSAALAWAAEEDGEVEAKLSLAVTSRAFMVEVVRDEGERLAGDTGASHCLLPLGMFPPETPEDQVQRIGLSVASGSERRALLSKGLVYAKNVRRILLSIGQLCSTLSFFFLWMGERPSFVLDLEGELLEVIRVSVENNLPVLEHWEATVILKVFVEKWDEGPGWSRDSGEEE